MTNSHVFSRNQFLWLRKSSLVSSLVFEIAYPDTLHYFVEFWTVLPNSIASPIPQNWKIVRLNCKEVSLSSNTIHPTHLIYSSSFEPAPFLIPTKFKTVPHHLFSHPPSNGSLNIYIYNLLSISIYPLLTKNLTRENLPTILRVWID